MLLKESAVRNHRAAGRIVPDSCSATTSNNQAPECAWTQTFQNGLWIFFKIKQRFQQTGSISKMFVYRESKVEPEEMFLLFFIQSCWISRLAFVLLVCSKKLNKKTPIWMMRSSKWFADVWERLLWTKLSYLYSYGCFVIYMLKTFSFSFVQYVFR